jgi:hypothetical protein
MTTKMLPGGAFALLVLVAVSGCTSRGGNPTGLAGLVGNFGYSETEILERDWITRDELPPPAPIYCYRTLGEATCVRQAIEGEESRLIGAYRTKK